MVYPNEVSFSRENLIEVSSVVFGFRAKDLDFEQFVGKKNSMI